ncbi:unnamed protein product [Phytophthora lilii]|uniref:Unnamed protein product n=1 Tax=Phytophthora lilii TaxID=2077276 RepID=A0A9W6X8U3_9STRA|nr:unnamed protein product [Phytophthora lilii]
MRPRQAAALVVLACIFVARVANAEESVSAHNGGTALVSDDKCSDASDPTWECENRRSALYYYPTFDDTTSNYNGAANNYGSANNYSTTANQCTAHYYRATTNNTATNNYGPANNHGSADNNATARHDRST